MAGRSQAALARWRKNGCRKNDPGAAGGQEPRSKRQDAPPPHEILWSDERVGCSRYADLSVVDFHAADDLLHRIQLRVDDVARVQHTNIAVSMLIDQIKHRLSVIEVLSDAA